MVAESPTEAADEFLSPLRRALSCITNEWLSGGYVPARATLLNFPNANDAGYIRLQSTHASLAERGFIEFRLLHGYIITQEAVGWAVHTLNYMYEFQVDNGREIVAYHFDPDQGKVRSPHLHVRGLIEPLPLSRAHFPTGRVSIEEVISTLAFRRYAQWRGAWENKWRLEFLPVGCVCRQAKTSAVLLATSARWRHT